MLRNFDDATPRDVIERLENAILDAHFDALFESFMELQSSLRDKTCNNEMPGEWYDKFDIVLQLHEGEIEKWKAEDPKVALIFSTLASEFVWRLCERGMLVYANGETVPFPASDH